MYQNLSADSVAYVYNVNGVMLLKTKILGYGGGNSEIEVENKVPLLKGDVCKVLIISKDAPMECWGKIQSLSSLSTFIAIGQEKTSEHRKFKRYKSNAPGSVISLVYHNYAYTLYKPFLVKMVDISQGGMRIRTPNNAFIVGCRFEFYFKLGNKHEKILTEIVSEIPKEETYSEYGCKFYARNQQLGRIAI